MTKAEAIFAFFSSFGLQTYEEGSVPDDAAFPYLTYPLYLGDLGAEVPTTADLWYRTATLAGINAKTDEIARALGIGGVKLPCDGGHIHVYCGTGRNSYVTGVQWASLMGDPDDDMVRRMHLNFLMRFNTIP